jgi:UDP-N-acetylglucosamine 2-epimerase (non-hydrolysing)
VSHRSASSLSGLAAAILSAVSSVLRTWQPQWVLVQGDTSSAYAAGLAAFYEGMRVGHVEAGLRTTTRTRPFPEEVHRRMLGHLTDLHFAPTAAAAEALLAEGVPSATIVVTGNTAIDSLRWLIEHQAAPDTESECPTGLKLLVTMHRRENAAHGFAGVCEALRALVRAYGPRLQIDLPAHPNPHVQAVLRSSLPDMPTVRVMAPLAYPAFVQAMRRATLILTDSGGVQEEAVYLGKPVLVLRDETERVEGVAHGAAVIVGTHPERIVQETSRLLDDPDARVQMARERLLYGDGHAADRIVAALHDRLR